MVIVYATTSLAYHKDHVFTLRQICVKIIKSKLSFFLFSFSFLFSFGFIFYFLYFRTLGLELEVISHTVTSVTSDSVITTLIIGLNRKK